MTSSQPTLQQVIAWAKEAGTIAREAFDNEHAIEMKGKLDLATEVDHACEKVLMDHIKQDFPTHAIVTEETGVIEGDEDNCWYIDPLDGTINYSHRLPVYAVSIAYAHNGKVTLGVVYDPSRDECFSAERGKGAWLNGNPIRVSSCDSLQKAILTTGLPSGKETLLDRNLGLVRHLTLNTQGIRRLGSVAIALCYAACGRTDGHWDQSSTPWDIAACALIVEEAGGTVTNLEGNPDYFNPPYDFVAGSSGIHQKLLSVVKR
jgi:myo-inositol-1(or 4)-monophosphatase